MLEQSIDFFILFVQDHRFWGYTILFIAMVLEGEVFLIAAGMLASLKAFDVGDVFWISFLGVVLGNVMWYHIGAKLQNTIFTRRIMKSAERVMTFFLPKFREKPFKSIFFSKFIYGANRATVVISGALTVPFKLFFKAELLASVVWVALYLSIGYFFGEVAFSTTRNASRLVLIAVIFVVGFILIQKLITHRYENRERKRIADQGEDRRNA